MKHERKIELVKDGHMTAEEAGDFLGFSTNSVRKLMDTGKIPYIEDTIDEGRRVPKIQRRIPRRAVIEYAANHLKTAETV